MPTPKPRSLDPEEWTPLVAWLDDSLRRGERGRLQGEYPVSLRPENTARHRVITAGERFLAHAMSHRLEARVDGTSLSLGLISLVYTDPAARGLGLASHCIEACVRSLEQEGLSLALLWTDRPSLYRRLGFHEIGRERLFALERRHLQRARRTEATELSVGPVLPADLPGLEALYAARSIRADREPGDLGLLLDGPGVEALVARGPEGPRGYAVLGRGDDFPSIVHEWAGGEDAVLACLDRFSEGRELVGLLGGPRDEGPLPTLVRAGATAHESHFAMARLLDPEALLRASTAGSTCPARAGVRRLAPDCVQWIGEGGELELPDAEFLRLVLGGPDAPAPSVLETVSPEEDRRLFAACWPWPLYLWGFDSI